MGMLEQNLDELQSYLNHWVRASCEQLVQPEKLEHSVGISFEPAIQLSELPEVEPIALGYYTLKSDASVGLQVIGQRFEGCSGEMLVMVELLSTLTQAGNTVGVEMKAAYLSSVLFERLFQPASVSAVG